MHDLSLYLLELLENSIRAGARTVEVSLTMDQATDRLLLVVEDDGAGLNAAPEKLLDPFYTTKAGKKTGLGLSLLRADAQASGGDLTVGSSPSLGGARVECHMQLGHVDRVPLGDVGKTIKVTAFTNPETEFYVNLDGDHFGPPLLRGSPAAAATVLEQDPKMHETPASNRQGSSRS